MVRMVLVWWAWCEWCWFGRGESGAGLVGNDESGAGMAGVRVVLV